MVGTSKYLLSELCRAVWCRALGRFAGVRRLGPGRHKGLLSAGTTPPCSHRRACRAFLFCRLFSSSMGYSLKSIRPSTMRAMGVRATSIFRVNLTRDGWEQPRDWYPAKLWGPSQEGSGKGRDPRAWLCSGLPRPLPHSLETESGDAQ